MDGVNVGTRSRIPPPRFFEFGFRAYLRHLSRYLHQMWCVRRKWGKATCGVVHVCPPLISKMADGSQVKLDKSLYLGRWLSDIVQILHTYRHISSADQDIFTKFGVYVDSGIPQRVEWSMYARLECPRWRTAAILNWLGLSQHNSAADCPIWLKSCTITHSKDGGRQPWNRK